MEFKDPSLSDPPLRRNLYSYSQTETATLNPSAYATQQQTGSSGSSSGSSSSYSNRNSNRNTEPLLTPGERVGAVIFGSISAIIAVYFVLLNVRIRRYRKKKPSESCPPGSRKQQRRRPLSVAKKEDEREIEQESNLTIAGGADVSSHNSQSSDMAIAEPKSNKNSATTRSNSDDDDTEADSCTYSLDEETTDPVRSKASHSRSPSAGDDSTRYTVGDSTKYTMDTRYTMDSSRYTAENRPKNAAGNRSSFGTEFSTRSYSLTTAFLDVIFPPHKGKQTKQNRRGGHNPRPDEDDNDVDLDSYYQRHEDDDDGADDEDSANTINSPFHPSPPRHRRTPPRLAPKKKNDGKQRTYFLSNDDSCLCADIGSGDARPADDGEDVFEGIPEEEDDRPFDCAVPTRRSGSNRSERPFDCYGEVGAYHNL